MLSRYPTALRDGRFFIHPFQQIMDPKMDSGFLEEGESLEDDYNVLGELLPAEILGIMDQMICHEVSKLKSPKRFEHF